MTIKEQIALDRALASLKVARRFLVHALAQLPETATGMTKDAISDARDQIDTAVGVVEESAK